jgi:hypothetical protein
MGVLLIMVKTFSEMSGQMLLDQIEFDGKNRFLPLSFRKVQLGLTKIRLA